MRLSNDQLVQAMVDLQNHVKLVQLEQIDGDPEFVDPDDVSRVEHRTADSSRIHLKGGKNFVVKGAAIDVRNFIVAE